MQAEWRKEAVLILDTHSIFENLRDVFAQEQADRLVHVLRDMSEQIVRTQERFDALVTKEEFAELRQTVSELAQAQVRTEERLTRLEAAVEELAQAQVRTERRVEELAQAQARTEEQLQNLIAVVHTMQNTLAAVKGRQLEFTYQQRAGAYFGPLLRRLRVLSPVELEDNLESHLSLQEFNDLLQLDLLISGWPRHQPDASQVWLAVEISSVVDRSDVERARRRAAALRRAGYRAIPAVAGEGVTEGAEKEARIHKVVLFQDGYASFWDEALGEILSE